jgi:hypothetical protein
MTKSDINFDIEYVGFAGISIPKMSKEQYDLIEVSRIQVYSNLVTFYNNYMIGRWTVFEHQKNSKEIRI